MSNFNQITALSYIISQYCAAKLSWKGLSLVSVCIDKNIINYCSNNPHCLLLLFTIQLENDSAAQSRSISGEKNRRLIYRRPTLWRCFLSKVNDPHHPRKREKKTSVARCYISLKEHQAWFRIARDTSQNAMSIMLGEWTRTDVKSTSWRNLCVTQYWYLMCEATLIPDVMT